MKKNLKTLATIGLIGVAGLGLMTGCGKEKDTSYIELTGLDTSLVLNQETTLEGAKILYYESKHDKVPDRIPLTEDMIENYSSLETGDKKLTISFANCSAEINYHVRSNEQIMEVYNSAIDNLLSAPQIKADMVIDNGDDAETQAAKLSVKNNSLYFKVLDSESQPNYEQWTMKDNEIWWVYIKTNSNCKKYDETEDILNNSINSILLSEYIEVPCSTHLGNQVLQEKGLLITSYEIKNGKTTINFMDNQSRYSSVEIDPTGRFTKSVVDKGTSGVYTSNISYTVSDSDMVALPDENWVEGQL